MDPGGELLKKRPEKQERFGGWEQSPLEMHRGSPMLQNGVKELID
jgi:hypothetical protein